jgi:formylglycine-generating enzyme required for sulfatase activity
MLTAQRDEADRIARRKGEAYEYLPRLSNAWELVEGVCVIQRRIKGTRVRTQAVVVMLLLLMLLTGAIAAVIYLQSSRPRINVSHLATAQPIPLNPKIASARGAQPRDADLIMIPGGIVQIGNNSGPPGEYPAFQYTSRGFLMDHTPVTVAQFAAFVRDTGYKTDTERYGSGGVLDEKRGAWVAVNGANWRRPTGQRRPAAQGNHPVTQVSWFDANAFCNAYGMRLPTEFEWERAARMGQTPDGHVFKAGDPIELSHRYLLNAWEGTFPLVNTAARWLSNDLARRCIWNCAFGAHRYGGQCLGVDLIVVFALWHIGARTCGRPWRARVAGWIVPVLSRVLPGISCQRAESYDAGHFA